MSLLTDQTFATGVTLNDLIHVVITGDTSQNPAGSSFKASIQQVFDSYTDIFVTGGTYNNITGKATFTNTTGGTFDVIGFTTGNTLQQVLVNGNTSNGNDIIMSEGDNIIFKYAGYSNNINTNPLTSNRVILFPDNSGTVALLSDIQTYTTLGITTSSSTLDINYTYYGVNYSGDVDLTLPDATGLDGNFLIIKDEGGNSGTYRIRLLSSLNLIDGNSYVDMNTNFMSLTIIARNNNWWII